MKASFTLALLLVSMVVLPAQNNTAVTGSAKIKDGPDERKKFSDAVGELFRQGDFESLERMGNELRTKKLKITEGGWKLASYYRGLDCKGSDAASFLAAEKQVKDWQAKYPDSISAPIAEGKILTSYGWFFRGTGYANTITKDGSVKFKKCLAAANDVLEKAKDRCSADPEWYDAMLTVGLGQGWDKAKFDQVFNEGVKLAPDYYELYFARVQSLLPRWYGAAGEWQAFAESEAEKHGPEIYTRCAWSVNSAYWPDKLFTEGRVSWPKMKAGFEKILQDFPNSNWNLNNYCRYACLAGDRATAKQLFDRIGSNRHAQCWQQNEFNQRKQWATKSE